MNGTQVTDIEKKVDYPKFKKGIKLISSDIEDSKEITNTISDNIKEVVDFDLASEISSNMKAESEAIEFYNKLLMHNSLLDEDREQIKEFISDEKNHLEMLSKMLNHYDSNIPIAKD